MGTGLGRTPGIGSGGSDDAVTSTVADLEITDSLVVQGSTTFNGAVAGLTKTMVGLANAANTTDANKPVSTATQTALDLKANLAGPTFTGTVAGISKAMVGLGSAEDTTDANKPISTATATALAAKSPIASPTFTGTVTAPTINATTAVQVAGTSVLARTIHTGTQTAATISDFATAADARITAQKGAANGLATLGADAKIPTAQLGPLAITTSTVVGDQAAQLALVADEGDVAIRSDQNRSYIRNAGTAATMADWNELLTPTDTVLSVAGRTGVITLTAADTGLGNVTNTSDANKPVSTATQTALDLKAPIASPTFTGTVSGVTKTHVGLANVDNTSDVNKPVSTAQAAADALKAPIASPTFTGTVAGVSKSMVGLGSADDTSDAAKPVSTATATALALKAPLASPTFTGTVAGITAAMVGLGSVDNTTDVGKPVSTAQAAADALRLELTGGTMTGQLAIQKAAGAALTAAVTADTQYRFYVDTAGGITWGSGALAGDINLYRSAAGVLATDGLVKITAPAGGLKAISVLTAGDTVERLTVGSGGSLNWSSGAATQDTNLYRFAADVLKTDDSFTIGGNLVVTGTATGTFVDTTKLALAGGTMTGQLAIQKTAGTALTTAVTADTQYRFSMDTGGGITWGSGALAGDTTLYRSAPDTLKTDDSFTALGTLYGGSIITPGITTTDGVQSSSNIDVTRGAAANNVFRAYVTGDTQPRLLIDSDGKHSWGPGSSTVVDTNLYRLGADTLKTDDNFIVGSTLSVTGAATFTSDVQAIRAAAGNATFQTYVSGDSQPRLLVAAGGTLTWGSGAATGDTTLLRDAADILRTNDEMRVDLALTAGYAAASTANVKLGAVGPASQACALFGGDVSLYRSSSTILQCDKSLYATTNIAARSASGQGAVTIGNVGTGATAGILLGTDTSLYRSAADTVKTDDALIVGGSVGFYGGTATAKQTVTGAKGSNAALGSLLTALAAIGLITDSSTT